MIKFKHVDGDCNKKIVLYALSTCGWCRRTEKFLKELGVGYDCVEADLVDGKMSAEMEKQVIKWSKKQIYPTIVIDNKEGFLATDLDRVRKVLSK